MMEMESIISDNKIEVILVILCCVIKVTRLGGENYTLVLTRYQSQVIKEYLD